MNITRLCRVPTAQTNLPVVKTLRPGDKAEKSEDLGLDSQRHIQLLDDIVHAKRDAGDGPQHHHRRLEAVGVVAPIIDEDLRQKLWMMSQVTVVKVPGLTWMDQQT